MRPLVQSLLAVAALTAMLCNPSAGFAETEKTFSLKAGSLRAGTQIILATTEELSSKTSQKGDVVQMVTKFDIRENGELLIPAGTKAVSKIADVMAKGAFGQSGRLLIEPLYIRIGDNTVRLTGGIEKKGSISAGAAVGLTVMSAAFTGRSATIPAGSELSAQVLNEIALPIIQPK